MRSTNLRGNDTLTHFLLLDTIWCTCRWRVQNSERISDVNSAAAKNKRTLAIIDNIDLSYGDSASHAEDRGTSSAEVDVSAKGKWTDAIAAVFDGGLRARLLRRFFLLNPPPLLAAVFPWDGGGEPTGGIPRWRSEASAEDRAKATVV
ncbi:hypothetical protein PIB30_098598 [Stylosanthes scabra]|uniref:Uncharacterized protein n=1 Tax=Stylosanthes scabra TaxID=79078 RepID=A0ABU6YY03_9FABA|nr:hypothetical protein [Stylosanthes scabra]